MSVAELSDRFTRVDVWVMLGLQSLCPSFCDVTRYDKANSETEYQGKTLHFKQIPSYFLQSNLKSKKNPYFTPDSLLHISVAYLS
jgi:hypothetical protein